MLLYHGSNVVVQKPDLSKSSPYTKEFGKGFYCTNNVAQATRWAIKKGAGTGFVTQYLFDVSRTKNLKVLEFATTDSDWLHFVAACRSGKKHSYDIVIGPMADDTIYNYVQSYLNKELSEEEFMLLARFNYATHQIVFCTEQAKACIQYSGYRQVQ